MPIAKEDLKVERIEAPSATKKTRPKGKASHTKKADKPTIPQLRNALVANFELVGALLSSLDPFDGDVIISKADDMADALIEVAKVNRTIRTVLEQMMNVGAWGSIVSVVGAQVMLPIAVHHELLPKPINDALAKSGDIPIRGKGESPVQEMMGT